MRNVMIILFAITSIMLMGTCRELELEQAECGEMHSNGDQAKVEYK
jgi:hypothetical protein